MWPVACAPILVVTPGGSTNSAVLILVSSRNDANGVRLPRFTLGIVTWVRRDERSSALLKFTWCRRSATEQRAQALEADPIVVRSDL